MDLIASSLPASTPHIPQTTTLRDQMNVPQMKYLLTAIGLTPGGSTTVHITHKQYTEQYNETEYT